MFAHARKTILGILCPPDDEQLATHEYIRRFEICMGLRPFRLVYPPHTRQPPRLIISRIGVAMLVAHSLLFVLSASTVLTRDALDGALAISDDSLALTESTIVAWLRVANAVAIFEQIVFRRDHEVLLAPLKRRVLAHLRAIGIDMRRMGRRTGAVLVMSFVFVACGLTTMYAHGFVYLQRTLPQSEQCFLFLYSVATVMPSLYIELVFVQFCMTVAFQRIRIDEVNEVLSALCEYENDAAEELGHY